MDTKKLHIYLYRFFGEFVPIMPLLGVMFVEKGLDLGQASLIFLTLSLTVLALEIPTGILADRTSPRLVIIAARIFKLLAFSCIYFFPNLIGYISGFALWGISSALDSGAFQSYLYSYVRNSWTEDQFTNIYSKSSTAGLLGMLVSSVLITQVNTLGYDTLQLIGLSSLFLSLVLVFALPHVTTVKEADEPTVGSTLRQSWKYVYKKKILLVLLITGVVAGGIKGTLDEYTGIMLSDNGLAIAILGFVLFGLELLTSLGATLAGWIKITTRHQIFLLIGFGIAFTVIGASAGYILPLILLSVIIIADGVLWIHNDAAIQVNAHDAFRATIGSMKNFGTELVALIIFLGVALGGERVDIDALYILMGMIMTIVALLIGACGLILKSRLQ